MCIYAPNRTNQVKDWGNLMVLTPGRNVSVEGLFVVNWAQIHNQSQAGIADRGLPWTLHFRENWQTELLTSHSIFLPSEPTLIKEVFESSFDQWTETCTVQSEMNSILICIFTDQSEQLRNDQSEGMILTNQDSPIWNNKTVRIWIPYLH